MTTAASVSIPGWNMEINTKITCLLGHTNAAKSALTHSMLFTGRLEAICRIIADLCLTGVYELKQVSKYPSYGIVAGLNSSKLLTCS